MSLRLRRLANEQRILAEQFANHPAVVVRPMSGDPPDKYRVYYTLSGLERRADGSLLVRREHSMEIVLPAEYPRQPAACRMLTPVFHPNIDTFTVCTSDFHAAQETLVDLIVRVGQMIGFQKHNVKSPLNAEAEIWCEQNLSRLPVDASDLYPTTATVKVDQPFGRIPPVLESSDSLELDLSNERSPSDGLAPLQCIVEEPQWTPPAQPFLQSTYEPKTIVHEPLPLPVETDSASSVLQSTTQRLPEEGTTIGVEDGRDAIRLHIASAVDFSLPEDGLLLIAGEITKVGPMRITFLLRAQPPRMEIRQIGTSHVCKIEAMQINLCTLGDADIRVIGGHRTSLAMLDASPTEWNQSDGNTVIFWNSVFASEAVICGRVAKSLSVGARADDSMLRVVESKIETCEALGMVGTPDDRWRETLRVAVVNLRDALRVRKDLS